MFATDHITHKGIVTGCAGDKATVQVFAGDSCHSCHIKEFCGVEDEERNRFTVANTGYKAGDFVRLQISPSSGLKATFWAYIFPFILIVGVLILGSWLKLSEAWSGSISLLILVPYFLVLWRLKKKISSGINLKVTRI